MRKILAVWVCAILAMSGFVILDVSSIVEGKLIVDEVSMYLTSNPLKIESNAAFITSPLVSGGAGLAGNPWIIENWEIDGTGYGYCIYIGNTTDHFIIKNCYLRDAIQFWGWPFYSGNGIALYNVWNGTLQSNNITSNGGYGISLDSTSNTTIFNNSVSESGDDNIELSSSNGNIISYNHLSTSWHRGLVFSASNNNIITNNTISDHYIDGISIWGCINNTFTNNTMIDDGIGIAGNNLPNWNTHEIGTTNTVNNKPVRYLKDQNSGTVPSGAGQVILANCSNMVVENQNVSDGTIGICLGFCKLPAPKGTGVYVGCSDAESVQ